jgi:hypothetical protein
MMNTSPREIAFNRVKFVFRRHGDEVRLADRFDVELKAQPPNDFRPNEFDQLLEDVNQMQSGGLRLDRSIASVEEFCAFAEQYARDHPQSWASLTREWKKEERMSAAPAWRRAVWRWIGV